MTRMKNILDRNILEFINNLEGSPHEAIAFLTIADSLYGNTDSDVSFFFFNIIVYVVMVVVFFRLVCYAVECYHTAGVSANSRRGLLDFIAQRVHDRCEIIVNSKP